jgi:hypothetical protein
MPKRQPHGAFCRELPATNRGCSCHFEGLRHQRSIEAAGEGALVIRWLIAGRGQQ